MKKALPPQAIAGIFGTVVVVLVVAAYLMFRPADAGPPVVAKPFSPHFGDPGAGASRAPNRPAFMGGASGAPIGAPAPPSG